MMSDAPEREATVYRCRGSLTRKQPTIDENAWTLANDNEDLVRCVPVNNRGCCSRYRESGSCDHKRSYYLHMIERGVVDIVRQLLEDPASLSAYTQLRRGAPPPRG